MGALYSREIHAAIDQLTSLVAAVQTTKNIFIFLAAIQVIKVIILALISMAILALLVTMNPDLEDERAAVVTPAVKWIIRRLSRFVPATHLQRDVELPRADTLQEKIPQVTRRRSSCESSQLS
jgi:heme/copper-type cytochrome/quinol oxidase subunit 2